MKLQILSLSFKSNQKYVDKQGDWKTYNSRELLFLDLGSINHKGRQCRVGFDSTEIKNCDWVRRNHDSLAGMTLENRIDAIASNCDAKRIFYFAENVIAGMGQPDGPDKNILVTGAGELKW